MEGRRLILANGTTIEDGEAGFSQGFLWLWFTGMTLAAAFALFNNPSTTAIIKFQYGDMEDVYDGFTSCRGVNIDADGVLSVCMVKGE